MTIDEPARRPPARAALRNCDSVMTFGLIAWTLFVGPITLLAIVAPEALLVLLGLYLIAFTVAPYPGGRSPLLQMIRAYRRHRRGRQPSQHTT